MHSKGRYLLLRDEDAYYFGSDRVVRNADAFWHHSGHRAVLVLHPELRVSEANDDFCFLTGFLEDEICDTPLEQLIPGFDPEPFWALDRDLFPLTQTLNILTQSGKLLEAQVELHLAINLLERLYLVLVIV